VINNNGGGIFSFLPVAQSGAAFERFFGTPHGLTFAAAAQQFGLAYAAPATLPDLQQAYHAACASGRPALLEVRTDRRMNHGSTSHYNANWNVPWRACRAAGASAEYCMNRPFHPSPCQRASAGNALRQRFYFYMDSSAHRPTGCQWRAACARHGIVCCGYARPWARAFSETPGMLYTARRSAGGARRRATAGASVGYSMGGRLALLLALQHPERFCRSRSSRPRPVCR